MDLEFNSYPTHVTEKEKYSLLATFLFGITYTPASVYAPSLGFIYPVPLEKEKGISNAVSLKYFFGIPAMRYSIPLFKDTFAIPPVM
ncbi:hypothetical protein [Robinsoniella sp. RHS]|uniref:hypothetical protein n=1 Tax=Robinsoniella sp. RHS TaxID=1504536 RepID=UPI00375337AF